MTLSPDRAHRAIEMPSFLLVPAELDDLDHPFPRLSAGLEGGFADHAAALHLLREVMATLMAGQIRIRWAHYWCVEVANRAVVGLAGFKAAPDAGRVEIGYLTFPRFEGRGYAKEAIACLVALAQGEVATIVAHTLPEPNASNAALARQVFAKVGTVIDPDDGPVWRWERDSAN